MLSRDHVYSCQRSFVGIRRFTGCNPACRSTVKPRKKRSLIPLLMKKRYQWILLVLLLVFDGCQTDTKKTAEKPANRESQEKNRSALLEQPASTLARSYCTGCHLLPDPGLLDRATWETILPRMGHYYGIYANDTIRDWLLEGGRAGQIVEQQQVFPKTPIIDSLIFGKISRYYLEQAPEQLTLEKREPIRKGLPHFRLKKPSSKTKNAMTLMVKIDSPDRFFISDAGRSSLSIMDADFQVIKTARSPEGTVWIHTDEKGSLALVIGTFNPTDMDLGFVMQLPDAPGQPTPILVQNLQRPVHLDRGDLDGDGLDDLLICEYGKQTGGLSWWKQNPNGRFQKFPLRNKPGATKAYIRDLNGNGKKDIIALFGQGDEGIFIYHNQGGGAFVEEPVLRFPPSYGSSFFDLVDFNADGHPDIVYTAGDNADYDPITKPYHGIRVFLNDGRNRFAEDFFYPLPGAYKAVPADFDGDGDLDIAAISFFPDFENAPEEGFVYLENKGEGRFEASTFAGSTGGRWMAMDVGDMDGDGDLDILLGSMVFGTDYTRYFQQWVEGSLPFLWLENTSE